MDIKLKLLTIVILVLAKIVVIFSLKILIFQKIMRLHSKLLRSTLLPLIFIITIVANTWINILTFILRVILLIFSAYYIQIFREYLISGPESSKTVIHYMAKSITFVYQSISVSYVIYCFLALLPLDLKDKLIQEFPIELCSLVSPLFLITLLLMYAVYIFLLKLLCYYKPLYFLTLPHETLAKILDVVANVIIIFLIIGEIIEPGHICFPWAASTVLANEAQLELNMTVQLLEQEKSVKHEITIRFFQLLFLIPIVTVTVCIISSLVNRLKCNREG